MGTVGIVHRAAAAACFVTTGIPRRPVDAEVQLLKWSAVACDPMKSVHGVGPIRLRARRSVDATQRFLVMRSQIRIHRPHPSAHLPSGSSSAWKSMQTFC